MNRFFKYCFIVQVLLAVYFQLLNWFPLGSLNAQANFTPAFDSLRSGKLSWSDGVFLFAFIVPVIVYYIGMIKKQLWLMILSIVFYMTWFILQITTWWKAYIFGADDRWYNTYQRVFSATHKILPSRGRHLPPDTEHLLIQIFLVLIFILFIKAMVQRKNRLGR